MRLALISPPFQTDYMQDHSAHCRFVDDLAATRRYDVIMLSLMADRNTLLPLQERVRKELGPRVNTHLILNKNYEGHILELLTRD